MAGDAPLIRVEHLSKIYDDPHVFGRSGSGKTTLGQSMLRLVEPTSGRVTVNLPDAESVELMGLGARQLRQFRRHLQLVFQDPYTSLNPRMTVRETVKEPLLVHSVVDPNDVDDRCREIVEQVGLTREVLDQRPDAMSGGQRQRVGIARAIASEPSFIVADEPVTALDVSVQAQILNLLRDLQDELGLSYLFMVPLKDRCNLGRFDGL